jgi:predicted nuclease with TOPRIM domain
MMKNIKVYGVGLILVITFLAILDNLNISDSALELKEENDKFVVEVFRLEKESGNSSNQINELKDENKRLAENLTYLEEEVDALKTTIDYQDFNDAINTIESYKSTKEFKDTSKFLTLNNWTGFTTLDREGNCPCIINFKEGSIEWKPNTVLELMEFKVEKEKILLTYNTVEQIQHTYQFVMIKGPSLEGREEKWRIEGIRLNEKSN